MGQIPGAKPKEQSDDVFYGLLKDEDSNIWRPCYDRDAILAAEPHDTIIAENAEDAARLILQRFPATTPELTRVLPGPYSHSYKRGRAYRREDTFVVSDEAVYAGNVLATVVRLAKQYGKIKISYPSFPEHSLTQHGCYRDKAAFDVVIYDPKVTANRVKRAKQQQDMHPCRCGDLADAAYQLIKDIRSETQILITDTCAYARYCTVLHLEHAIRVYSAVFGRFAYRHCNAFQQIKKLWAKLPKQSRSSLSRVADPDFVKKGIAEFCDWMDYECRVAKPKNMNVRPRVVLMDFKVPKRSNRGKKIAKKPAARRGQVRKKGAESHST